MKNKFGLQLISLLSLIAFSLEVENPVTVIIHFTKMILF